MANKLNNVLSFKEYASLCKLENKPGKVLERFANHNEGILWDSKEEKRAAAEKAIMAHPNKRKFYEKIKGTEKGDKYLNFFVKSGGNGYPKWDDTKNDFVETGRIGNYNSDN